VVVDLDEVARRVTQVELDDAARQLDQVVRNASSSKAAQRSAAR
jgi:hypothetical protein